MSDLRNARTRVSRSAWVGHFLVGVLMLGGIEAGAETATSQRFQFAQTEMSVPIELVLYARDSAAATSASRAVFDRFRQLNAVCSDYDPESELSRLSRSSAEGKPVAVSEDLWKVLVVAQDVAQRSDGAFDVTIGPLVRLWRRSRRHHELPTEHAIREAKQAVGYQFLRLDPVGHTAQLLRPGMRLDLGGIAKGYAVEECLKLLTKMGVHSAMIYAGGDVGLSDPPPGKPGWRIGVAPLEPGKPPSQYLWLSRCGVATSGDTWQYVQIGGKRYSHVVDAKTGLGLTDHCKVTLVCPSATLADALSTAVSVLGPEKGLALIDDTPGAAGWIIRSPEGKTETYPSARWKELPADGRSPNAEIRMPKKVQGSMFKATTDNR